MDFRIFLEKILSERNWSWSLVGAGYLAVTVVLRQFFFRGIVKEIKEIDAASYSLIRSLYLRKSLTGWIFFIGAFFLVIAGWINADMIRQEKKILALFCLLWPTLFSFSIVSHLGALTHALLSTLRQRMGVEKEF